MNKPSKAGEYRYKNMYKLIKKNLVFPVLSTLIELGLCTTTNTKNTLHGHTGSNK